MANTYSPILKTILLTALALIAFAANSILCRLALGTEAIDASGFTVIRLATGAVVLLLIVGIQMQRTQGTTSDSGINHNDVTTQPIAGSNDGGTRSVVRASLMKKGSWFAAVMLFTYAATFSFAYVSMDTGTGALILFGAVQLTMIAVSLIRGNRLYWLEWLGVILAFGGFVYLVLPGLGTPSLIGFILMSLSGVAWGFYTLRGQGSEDPLGDTTSNFARTVPMAIVLFVLMLSQLQLTAQGVLLAMLSGGIASGVGYTIWYSALRGLSSTQAAVLQLLVPVIAAVGGVIFMQEAITSRLLLSGVMILGGILLVVLGRYYLSQCRMNQNT
ncbi:DMT family transporter [Leucothrix pacifica]|uniref:DMT family transporter n=1 Tax=Leucothrix pacifica TaxID=1247513 RepID=UPI001FE3F0FD|nr:DMT family transporter [Leucothrix pacifica]